MNFERGHVYELDDGWGYVRLLEMFQEYDSFEPDEPGEKKVRLSNVNEESNRFVMEFSDFRELVIKDCGFSVD